MSKALTYVSLTEQADLAYARGELEPALRNYATVLAGDPEDLYAWYRCALTLGKLGNFQIARQALKGACSAFAESGELLLAICCANDVRVLDQELSRVLTREIAERYGKDAQRVVLDRRPSPPSPPQAAVISPEMPDAEGEVLLSLASDACLKAYEIWEPRISVGQAPLPYQPLLCELSCDELESVIPLMQLRVALPEQRIIEQGSEDRALFVIVRGMMEVRKDNVHLAFLRSHTFFGEMALLTDSARVASVVSYGGPVTLLVLQREALEDLAAKTDGVANVLAEYARERLLRNLMVTCPLFAPLDIDRRLALVALFESQVYDKNETVIQEGDESQGLHVVLSGRVSVTKQDDDESLKLADLGAGDIFGEISLIQRRPATATVTALSKTVVLQLPRDAFNAHVVDFPEVLAHVYRLAIEREQANVQIENQEQTVTLEDLDAVLV